MRLSNLLSKDQIETIHQDALRVLAEVGVKVEHKHLRERLAGIGGQADGETVRFDPQTTERLIQDAPKDASRRESPRIEAGCNVYQCMYLDPAPGDLRPFDEDLLARYYALARKLPNVEHTGLLGLPFVPEDIPAPYLPLAEKLYAWRHGASPGGSVHFTQLCEPLLDMFRIHAGAAGKRVQEIFAACGFMVSPLRLARPECEQLLFFAEHGLRMGIGHLQSQGGSAPVTFAGTLVLSLAEQMALFLVNRSIWEDAHFAVGGMATTIDMRTGMSCYGRPERTRINLAFADIADFYGCACWGHTGCTDAHTPSCEAGVQKASGTLMTALATGYGYIEAGLLGIDEICSPVQMALDSDLVGSLRALLAEASVDEHAFEEIRAVGPGGSHLGTESTAERFRTELWEPLTWSNQSLSAWQSSGMRTDLDKARDIVADFESDFMPTTHISDEEERALREVIRRAVRIPV